ncbi:nickel insertion protein, partial [Nocardioides salarius]|uniref:nickel insertion protein n=1 Tax=Nocardioides salarius TaxID=374513 RepID=UPI0030F852C0
QELVVEANVDDLDPRLWPGVLEALLAAGAADAWLSPITMKKGRPAHTLSVLVRPALAERVRDVVFAQTSTIGLREHAVTKRALEREVAAVEVEGVQVRVKVSRHRGRVVTAQPEWDDVAAVAQATGRPARDVLAEAQAAARSLVE